RGERSEAIPAPPPADPNDTRLMFAPNGRPLGKGNGYVSNHYVLFPGFAYGLTKNLNVGGGVSTIPGLGLDEQLFYATAQRAFRPAARVAFGGGGVYAGGGRDEALGGGGPYGGARTGPPPRSLTLGLGGASTPHDEPQFDARGYYVGDRRHWRSEPILMVGG